MTVALAPVRVSIHVVGHRGSGQFVDTKCVWAEGGLAVTRAVPRDTGWSITHVHSGYAVMLNLRTRALAIRAAKKFRRLGDWTRSRTAIGRDVELRTASRALRRSLEAGV